MPPAPIGFGPTNTTHHLTAVPHSDCDKYWVISVEVNTGRIHLFLIDSDNGPNASTHMLQGYAIAISANTSPPTSGGIVKSSPDGSMLAFTRLRSRSRNQGIDIMSFDRATGAIGPICGIDQFGTSRQYPLGIEFSPDNQWIYYTNTDGHLKRHLIGTNTTNGSLPSLYSRTTGQKLGLIQLAPNGKIYGVKRGLQTLFAVTDPNNSVTPNVNDTALDNSSGNLTLPNPVPFGLPNFTRIPPECITLVPPSTGDDVCTETATEVNEILSTRSASLQNQMLPCNASDDWEPESSTCVSVNLPEMSPNIQISWGDSDCDCIESDDTEIMTITVCNPFSNITYSGFTIHKVEVLDSSGNAVATLPDGTDSIELVPVGPYCFGNISGCSCVSREFVLRNRGSMAGEYHIHLSGICYDVNVHNNSSTCFKFDICKD